MSHKKLTAEERSLLGRIERSPHKGSRRVYRKRESQLRRFNFRLKKDVKRLGA